MEFSCAMLFGEAILDASFELDPVVAAVSLIEFADGRAGAPESDEAAEGLVLTRAALALVRNGVLRT